jgi:hypothetical protein
LDVKGEEEEREEEIHGMYFWIFPGIWDCLQRREAGSNAPFPSLHFTPRRVSEDPSSPFPEFLAALLAFRPLARPFRIVSDFDGVWTEPARERERVLQTLELELARLSGEGSETVAADCREFTGAVMARPWDFG